MLGENDLPMRQARAAIVLTRALIVLGYPEYDPGQDRDEHGRWTGGGGGSSGGKKPSSGSKPADYISPYRGPKPIVRKGPLPSQALRITLTHAGLQQTDEADVLINPSLRDVEDLVDDIREDQRVYAPTWATNDDVELRSIEDTSGNVFLWDASQGIHGEITSSPDWEDQIEFDYLRTGEVWFVPRSGVPPVLRNIIARGQENANKPEAKAAREQAEK